MKFQMLEMGARFEFEGKVYVKSGPLTATTEAGESRMIPRFALLKPLDVSRVPSRTVSRKLDAAKVTTAFEGFYRECLGLLSEEGDVHPVKRNALAAARERFLSALSE